MRPAKLKYKLWHILLAVAIFAGLFAVFGVIDGIGVLIAISTVFLPIVMASPSRRLSVAAWVCSLYPVLLIAFLLATWFTAWCALGHEPRMSLDDPKYISPTVNVLRGSTYLLMLGVPISMLLCLPLKLPATVERISQRRIGLLKRAVQPVIPLLIWLSFFAILGSGLFEYIIGWFID
jgi:hypothetical protein